MRLASLMLLLSITACSGTGVGTGTGTSGSSGSSSSTTDTGGTTSSGGTDTSTPDTSAYDALFDAPASTTTTDGAVTGVWAGTLGQYDDVRLQISAGTVRIAMRCDGKTGTSGMDVPALVTSSEIKILASKSFGQAFTTCSMSTAPQDIPACSSANDIGCFTLAGTSLDFVGVALFTTSDYEGESGRFLKLSD